jgi:IS4 transposase
VLLAQEQNPPDDTTPISWLLLTTLPVNSFDQAVECVRWYSYRWLIERYHYVLKSGCHLEQLQLETAERIECALGTYCIVGWRLLWLTYEARYQPDIGCDTVLQTHEWQAFYCTIHSQAIPPATPPSLRLLSLAVS